MSVFSAAGNSVKKIDQLATDLADKVAPEVQATLAEIRAEAASLSALFADLVTDADKIVEAFPAQWQSLVREGLAMLGQGRSLVAALNRVTEKASRKLDGIPDRLFPLTIQTPDKGG